MSDMMGLLTGEDLPQVTAFELTLAKQMADTLHKQYPGHLWAVRVSAKTGMADILNLALSGKWGYRLKLQDHYSASDWDREAMRAGGEILERFKQVRRRVNIEAVTYLPVNFAGHHQPLLD